MRCALIVAAGVTVGVLAAVGPATATAKMTHKVTIEGEWVNNWTVSEDKACGPVGAGKVSVKFRTGVTRVRPYVDRDAGRQWNVAIPYGRHLQGMSPVDAPGTITRVDNTTKRPIAPDEPCPPPTRLGCGTFPLTGKPVASVNGHDRRRIALRVVINYEPGRECLIGGVESWGGPRAVVGGNRVGEMLFDMPRPSAFRRRSVVRLRESTHKRSTFSDPGDVESNDITRKATVTFKRL